MDRKQVKEKARYAFIREKANQIQEKSRHKYSVPGAFTVIGRARDIKQYGSDTEESNSATDSLEGATISAVHRVLRSARYAKGKKNTFLDETDYDRDLGSENEPDAGFDPTGMRFTVKRISEENNISASPQKLMREEAVNDYKAQIHQKRYDASMSETDIPPYKEKADRPYIKTRETTQARHTSSQVASRHIQPSGSKAQELKAQAVREQGRRLARNTSIKQGVHKQSRRDSALRTISLALQGYNFGSGYISWAMRNYGGYSELNALEFSEMMAKRMGWTGYGDPQYVQHVMRYYTISTATPQD